MFAALQSLLTQSDPLYTLYVIHYTEFQTDGKCWLLALLHLGQAGKIFYPGFVLMDFCVKCLKYQDEEIFISFLLFSPLLLPDLGLEEVAGDGEHPVPPGLRPDQPGLHLPPPPLHLLLGDVETL